MLQIPPSAILLNCIGNTLFRNVSGTIWELSLIHIYGRSFKEIAQNVQQGVYLPDGGRYIYVFSLTGEPLCRYVLDHYVYGISVDEQKGIILATDVNKDDPIIEYSMK